MLLYLSIECLYLYFHANKYIIGYYMKEISVYFIFQTEHEIFGGLFWKYFDQSAKIKHTHTHTHSGVMEIVVQTGRKLVWVRVFTTNVHWFVDCRPPNMVNLTNQQPKRNIHSNNAFQKQKKYVQKTTNPYAFKICFELKWKERNKNGTNKKKTWNTLQLTHFHQWRHLHNNQNPMLCWRNTTIPFIIIIIMLMWVTIRAFFISYFLRRHTCVFQFCLNFESLLIQQSSLALNISINCVKYKANI